MKEIVKGVKWFFFTSHIRTLKRLKETLKIAYDEEHSLMLLQELNLFNWLLCYPEICQQSRKLGTTEPLNSHYRAWTASFFKPLPKSFANTGSVPNKWLAAIWLNVQLYGLLRSETLDLVILPSGSFRIDVWLTYVGLTSHPCCITDSHELYCSHDEVAVHHEISPPSSDIGFVIEHCSIFMKMDTLHISQPTQFR